MFVVGKTPDAVIVIGKGEELLGVTPLFKCKGECVASVNSIVQKLPRQSWIKYLALDRNAGSYVYTEKEVKGEDVYGYSKHTVFVTDDRLAFVDVERSFLKTEKGVKARAGITIAVDETAKLNDSIEAEVRDGIAVPDAAVYSSGDTLKYFLIVAIKNDPNKKSFDYVKVRAVLSTSDGGILEYASYKVPEEVVNITANVEGEDILCLTLQKKKGFVKICINDRIYLERSA